MQLSKPRKECIKRFLLGKNFEDVSEYVQECQPLRIRISNINGTALLKIEDFREYRLNLRVVEAFSDGEKHHRIIGYERYSDGWF